jgi:hypothetical protein
MAARQSPQQQQFKHRVQAIGAWTAWGRNGNLCQATRYGHSAPRLEVSKAADQRWPSNQTRSLRSAMSVVSTSCADSTSAALWPLVSESRSCNQRRKPLHELQRRHHQVGGAVAEVVADLDLCAPVVEAEAFADGKTLQAH